MRHFPHQTITGDIFEEIIFMFPMRTHARGKIATVNVFNASWSEPGCENMVLTHFGGIWSIHPRAVRAHSSIRAIAFLGC